METCASEGHAIEESLALEPWRELTLAAILT